MPFAVTIVEGADNTCRCEATFEWDSGTSLCEIACTEYNNASATLDTSSCACDEGFVWKTSPFGCYSKLETFDCDGVSFSSGIHENGEECLCEQGYQWER